MSTQHPDTSASHHGAIRLAYGDDAQQFGELYLPDGTGPHPVVILIHGGFWRVPYDLTLMSGLAQDLARRGIAAWNIEYRRVGDAGGGWPGTLQDVAHAADYLHTVAATYALDLHRIVPIGHSAGGQLGFWLVGRPRIAADSPLAALATTPLSCVGAVSLAGALDLEHTWRLNLGKGAAAEFLGGAPGDVPERYAAASPAALLPLGVPQVLIHGTSDDRVLLEVSQAYAHKAQAAGDPVTLIELPGADHFVLIDPTSAAWGTTLEETIRLLG
jgi:acetyl esterase/lipase